MNQEGMLKPALIAGVLLGIVSVIPVINWVNCFCCAWAIAGGILAAHLHVKDSPVPVTLGRGVGLGLLTGAIGALVTALFSIPLQFLFSGGMDFSKQIREVLERLDLPPEAEEALRPLITGGSGVGLLFLLMACFMTLIFYGLTGMLGGAIGVAIFEKRKPGTQVIDPTARYEPPPDIPPPPPPPPPIDH